MDTFKKIVGKIAYPGRFRSMLIVLSGFGLLAYIYATKQSTSFLAYVAYVLSAEVGDESLCPALAFRAGVSGKNIALCRLAD